MPNSTPPQLAIIGATASGKSSLALELAERSHALILSLDSLSIYKEIDIASAKPTKQERKRVPHFGIDLLFPDEPFDVTRFAKLYERSRQISLQRGVPLIVVGGSGFYLKALLEGMSPLPEISDEQRREVASLTRELSSAYELLTRHDPSYARKIDPSDRYRIEKALLILLSTGQGPSRYFQEHPPSPIIEEELPIFEIHREREELRERIELRTRQMLDAGLLDEVASLEHRYERTPNPMKAIGIKEVLAYFDGLYSFEEMREKIVTNTARLAKRQQTFNRSQFDDVQRGESGSLRSEILQILS